MSIGKMNTFIDIISTEPHKDNEGFVTTGDHIISSVRACKEKRHGNEKWANRTVFSSATALFRFRKIPDIEITTDLIITCSDGRYNIVSVEDIKGRGMYIEVLCTEVKSSG